MVSDELRKLADILYAVHVELISYGVLGKDCRSFAATLDKIGMIQAGIRKAAMELDLQRAEPVPAGNKEAPNV